MLHELSFLRDANSEHGKPKNSGTAPFSSYDEDFRLTTELPADRESRAEKHRLQMSQANKIKRDRLKTAGISSATLFIANDHMAMIDSIKKTKGLRNCSEALALALRLIANEPAILEKVLSMDG